MTKEEIYSLRRRTTRWRYFISGNDYSFDLFRFQTYENDKFDETLQRFSKYSGKWCKEIYSEIDRMGNYVDIEISWKDAESIIKMGKDAKQILNNSFKYFLVVMKKDVKIRKPKVRKKPQFTKLVSL